MTWTYVVTAAVMVALPGPDVLLLSGRALERGAAAALRTLAGTVIGYAVLTALVATGLGTVLSRWSGVHLVLQVAAVGYLLWLAYGAWRRTGAAPPVAGGAGRIRGELRDGFLTATLNPKGLLFFVALLPPFVDPTRPATGQLLALGLVFCALTVVVYGAVVALAAGARARLAPAGRATGRASAVVLAGAAALVAGMAVT